ncbi:MAG: hypothetical protein M0R33_22380 [Methylomonas sp.]|jgi:hypothetical protein|uniref:hypothetical protein n=1 Tax=Methylomonas sp. TaxID=418 RepID=UPI0025DCC6AD|nr:hypothetical protein [Methylomonas sp.]MCK9609192.1 hypothetical protein [Methylomonas sp.]
MAAVPRQSIVPFKSDLNVLNDHKEIIVRGESTFTVAQNSSIKMEIAFSGVSFVHLPPHVLCSLSVDDERFGINYHICARTATGFSVVIENLDAASRTGTLIYTAQEGTATASA